MRDKLIHGYFGVNLKRVWETVRIDLPPLQDVVIKMLTEHTEFEIKPYSKIVDKK